MWVGIEQGQASLRAVGILHISQLLVVTAARVHSLHPWQLRRAHCCFGSPFRALPKMLLGSQAGRSSALPVAPLLLPRLPPCSPALLPLLLKAWAKMTGWARPRSSTPCSRRNCSLSTARSRARVEWLPTSSSGRSSGIWLSPRLHAHGVAVSASGQAGGAPHKMAGGSMGTGRCTCRLPQQQLPRLQR